MRNKVVKLCYICNGLYNWRGTLATDKDIIESVGVRMLQMPRLGDVYIYDIVAKIIKYKARSDQSYKIIKYNPF